MRELRRANTSCGSTKTSEANEASSTRGQQNLANYGSCRIERPLAKATSFGQSDKQLAGELDGPEPAAAELTKLELIAAKIPCFGIMLALMASVFLGSAGMLVKMTHSVHGIQVAVFRAYIQLAIYSGFIVARRLPLIPEAKERLPVFGRAFLGSVSITFSYYALKLIPLGDATTIRFSLPIWTLIISYVVLNESCSLLKICSVIVSITGVILIAKPNDCTNLYIMIAGHLGLPVSVNGTHNAMTTLAKPEDEPKVVAAMSPAQHLEGCLLALSSSIFLSMSLIALRLCKRTPAEVTIFWLSVWSIMVGTITLLALNEFSFPNNWLDALYILLNGLCGSLGQWFITSALKVEQSGVIALARTFDIQVAFLYSAFLLHEQIRLPSIIGSLLVSMGVISVIVPGWLNSRRRRRSEAI